MLFILLKLTLAILATGFSGGAFLHWKTYQPSILVEERRRAVHAIVVEVQYEQIASVKIPVIAISGSGVSPEAFSRMFWKYRF